MICVILITMIYIDYVRKTNNDSPFSMSVSEYISIEGASTLKLCIRMQIRENDAEVGVLEFDARSRETHARIN